jgi:hypothetical protein
MSLSTSSLDITDDASFFHTFRDFDLCEELEDQEAATVSGGLSGYEYGPSYTGPIYSCLTNYGKSVLVGKYNPSSDKCYVGWYGKELALSPTYVDYS